MPTLRRLLIDLTVMIALGLALALLGPFGSFAAPFAVRLLFWLLVSLGGYFLYTPVVRGADALARRLQLPAAALWAAGCAVATVPMTAVVWLANGLWSRVATPSLDAAASLYGNVFIVAAIACVILWFVTAHRRRVEGGVAVPPVTPAPFVQEPAAAAPDGARLLARLPPHLGRELLALEMEDHYARAHTAAGSTLLLMRMRDAVAEVDGIDGAQVHRSWWVARAAVTGTLRDGRNLRLKLSNGIEAPVARAVAPELKAAGWW